MSETIMLPEYLEAIKSIQVNPVTFISGSAGTGKSTFIKTIRKKLPNSLLLAPTGIAAINISGRTIHSTFKLPPTFITPEDIKILDGDKRNYIKQVSLIIIDEISMVSSNLLDAIDEFLRENLRVDKPFGGKKVLLVGDLFQLAPVVSRNIEEIYYQYYTSAMFFGSSCIQELIENKQFKTIQLTKVLRQTDMKFINLLNNIRTGTDIDKSIRELNESVQYSKSAPDGYVQITPYNDASNFTNEGKLDLLDSVPKTYFGSIVGNFNTKNVPVPQALTLKVGAQVMVCKNIPDLDVVNGTIGKIHSMESDAVNVKLPNGNLIRIESAEWDEYNYVKNSEGKVTNDVVGTFSQIPLKLAWSMTIHKVQSATIQKLYIDMDRGAFADGMLYVAISRAVSLDGLMLSKPLNASDVMVSEEVIEFYKNII